MKTFTLATTAAVLGAAATLAPVNAWWDNGHMLVGEVASQLMNSEDRATIEKVLSAWNADFPNTNKPATAAIWADLVKCNKDSSFCITDNVVPSFAAMDKWHYVNLPLFANGAKYAEADLNLFAASFGGDAGDVMDKFLATFNTTRSLWAANLGLRQLIHILGDVHNPMHAVGGISEKYPLGDSGGNSYKFQTPCPASNLHALYDAAGGEYSLNNWSKDFTFYPALQKNASELVEWLPLISDTINLGAAVDNLSYAAFIKSMTDNSFFKKFILESYVLSTTFVYPSLDLNFNAAGFVPCPSAEYFSWAASISKFRIALGGKRLAVILSQIAKQFRANGLA